MSIDEKNKYSPDAGYAPPPGNGTAAAGVTGAVAACWEYGVGWKFVDETGANAARGTDAGTTG